MQLASGTHIPDGLLAVNALLSEKLHQGSATYSGTLHQGFGVVISSTPLGIISPLYDGDVRSRCTGKERDTESGLDYFGARYYASSMGRFSSPDPLGNFVADMSNPQSWNMYAYAGNNPLRNVDPDGYDYCQWDDGTRDDRAGEGGASNDECLAQGGTITLEAKAKPPVMDNYVDLLSSNTSGMISGRTAGPMMAFAGAGFRQLDPSNQECQALAKKIDNLVDQVTKRTDAIQKNPLNLPQSAPGPLRGSVDGHQQLLQGYIDSLGAAADLYNQKCGGGMPGGGGSPSPAGSPSPSSSSSLKRAMIPIAVTVGVGVGVVGTAILCPECLVAAPLLVP